MNILESDSYKKELWKTGIFVICFYVKIFVERLKNTLNEAKFKKLRVFHY